jgi:hypothetical protein
MLSSSPDSIKQILITGGIPPVVIDDVTFVYEVLYPRVKQCNIEYYKKYPLDVARVRTILCYLHRNQTTLPNSGNLTIRRFLQLGLSFGKKGGYDSIHQLVFMAAKDIERIGTISYKTLTEIQQEQSFDTNILYAILHEAIYVGGQGICSGWAAERVRNTETFKEMFPWQWKDIESTEGPIYFTSEMIYSWQFEDYAELRPLANVAQILANYDEWPVLYDIKQLKNNTVPIAGTSYFEDMCVSDSFIIIIILYLIDTMLYTTFAFLITLLFIYFCRYVDFKLAEQAVNAINGFKWWVTNEYAHNALHYDGERIVKHLLNLIKGMEDL